MVTMEEGREGEGGEITILSGVLGVGRGMYVGSRDIL